jgi:membrane associated rhomboid family serine protease
MSDLPSREPIPEPAWEFPSRRPVAWVTWLLVGTTVAVFVAQLVELHRLGDDVVGNTLAFSADAFAAGRWWTLLTYAWAHAVSMFGDSGYFWLHIVANMIPLICLGPALEEFLGHLRYLGLYLGGAIAAALTFYALNLNAGGEPIIGASGAVFAVIAGVGTAAPRARVKVYLLYVIPISMTLRTLALIICGAEIAQAAFGWLPEIAHSAHLGGAVFGFLYVGAVRLARYFWNRRTPYL